MVLKWNFRRGWGVQAKKPSVGRVWIFSGTTQCGQTWSFVFDTNNTFYYMEESVLLGTKPLVDSIRHFIQDPSGVFSVCHLCECRIVQ